jgi:choline dehydrogenase-like flavoprotein
VQASADQILVPEPGGSYLHGGNHQYGTTRMHDSPRKGVVDRHCRVHGTDNLYVAGSSVFPTTGSANPTLTIVALAARLAARLAEPERPVVVR